jgi:hypothetical protein
MMKILMVLALVSTAAFAQAGSQHTKAARPSLKDTILDREKATWETLKQKDYAGFGDLLAENFLAIDNTGITQRADFLKAMHDLILNDYLMEQVKVMPVASGVALITYEAKLKGSYQGKELSRPVYAASVWVKHGAKWLQAFNQESEAQ